MMLYRFCLVLLAGLLLAPPAHSEVIERIVAIVNSEIITQTDLDKYAARLKQGGLVDDLLIPDDATKQATLADRDKLLKKMIDERLMDSEVKRQNLQVPPEKVEQEIRSIARRNNVTREQLQQALQQQGVVFSQYQDFIKTGLERQALVEKSVTSRIKITEQDILSYYAQKNKNAENQVFEYTLAHAVFLKAKDGPEAAKNKAKLFLKRFNEGGNFEKLAGEMSEDPNFETGGLLGTFKSGEMIAELEAAAKGMQPGDVSGLVETKTGFHILKILSKKLVPDPRYEKERESIQQVLYDQAYRRQIQSWLEQLSQDAFIHINLK